jgi:hypothetical protein
MTQYTISNGSRQVIITEQDGRYSCRLYVNNGETATTQSGKAKTQAGIERTARRLLGLV